MKTLRLIFARSSSRFISPQRYKLSRPIHSLSSTTDSTQASVSNVERILRYEFKDKKLLEEALTHPSFSNNKLGNYQRLEFIGDAALECAVSGYLFKVYPELGPGELTLLRRVNVSTERLARVAVKCGIYKYLRHNAVGLDDKVKEFALAVQEEKEICIYGGLVKAPKVLADVVESVAAAMYVDCDCSIHHLWQGFKVLLEPTITYEDLQKHPVTTLFELCQKEGKRVDIKRGQSGAKRVSSVFVDGKFIVSSHIGQHETAKLFAAKEALEKLEHLAIEDELDQKYKGFKGVCEIDGAKQKLLELCGKNNWPKPTFSTKLENGPACDMGFVCSIHIKANNTDLVMKGNRKFGVRAAENSASSLALLHLKNGFKLSRRHRPGNPVDSATILSSRPMVRPLRKRHPTWNSYVMLHFFTEMIMELHIKVIRPCKQF